MYGRLWAAAKWSMVDLLAEKLVQFAMLVKIVLMWRFMVSQAKDHKNVMKS